MFMSESLPWNFNHHVSISQVLGLQVPVLSFFLFKDKISTILILHTLGGNPSVWSSLGLMYCFCRFCSLLFPLWYFQSFLLSRCRIYLKHSSIHCDNFLRKLSFSIWKHARSGSLQFFKCSPPGWVLGSKYARKYLPLSTLRTLSNRLLQMGPSCQKTNGLIGVLMCSKQID